MRKKIIISVLIVIFLLVSAYAQTNNIHPDLEARLQKLKTGEKLTIIVELKEQVNLDEVVTTMSGVNRRQKARAVVTALRNSADKNQRPLKQYLKRQEASGAVKRVIPFWIFNGFAVTANETMIRHLASRLDVKEIRLDSEIPLPSPAPTAANPSSAASEWNISIIRAPEVWTLNPAYNGSGAVIGSFDTGVSLSHDDLYSAIGGTIRSAGSIPTVNMSLPMTSTAMEPIPRVQPWEGMLEALTSESPLVQPGSQQKVLTMRGLVKLLPSIRSSNGSWLREEILITHRTS